MPSLAKKVTYFLKNDLEKLEEPIGSSHIREWPELWSLYCTYGVLLC
jgi:hypothetical protein